MDSLSATISNTANFSYQIGATPQSQNSNTVTLSSFPSPARAAVQFFRYAPGAPATAADGGQCRNGGGVFNPIPPVTDLSGAPINTASAQIQTTGIYHAGEPVFVSLTDGNRNTDSAAREFVDVSVTTTTGDSEVLRLQETAPNTGVFVTAIQSAAPPPAVSQFDCRLSVGQESSLTASYSDTLYAGDSVQANALVDPFGVVFNSTTGAPVNGATVTLINATGAPATVFGDDGVSTFPATVISGGTATDSAGTLYPFPPGGFRFPFVPPGNYVLQVTPPAGLAAPSTVPLATLQNVRDPSGNLYAVGAGSFGDQFTVAPGPTINIDIPVDPLASALFLQKSASTSEVSAGDFLQYRLTLENRNAATTANNVVITDTLPLGMRYKRDSLRINGQPAADPTVSADGRTLSISIATIAANGRVEVSYVVQVGAGARIGQATNRAQAAAAGGLASNVAQAIVKIREPFFTSQFTLIGRVVQGDCGTPWENLAGVPNVRIMLDDGSYVATDKDGLFHFEGVRPGTHVVQLDLASLPKHLEVIPCIQNSRFAGRSFSQFVEAQGGTLWRADFYVRAKTSPSPPAYNTPAQAQPSPPRGDGVSDAQPSSASGGGADPKTPHEQKTRPTIMDDATAAGGKTDWLLGQAPGTEWLFPDEKHNPRAPAVRIAIKHSPAHKVVLKNKDAPVHELNFDGVETNAEKTIAVSVWRGVPVAEGDNRFDAEVVDEKGTVVARLSRVVHYANSPARAVFVPEESILVADGINKPVIAVRVLDRDGRPVRAGVTGAFRVNPPYVPAQQLEFQQQRQLAGLDRYSPTFKVEGDEGIAYIELAPTTETGTVVLSFSFQQSERTSRDQELRVWLDAKPRDWVVVGFAAGTVGYDTLKGNMQSLDEQGREDGGYSDGQVSLYAKGRVLGKWLLTLAYDTDKPAERRRRESVLSTIDPNEFYTLYGDGTEQRYDAASQEKLYLKLERDQFYALFGDYDTGLTQTKLSRYSRTLTGVKSEFRGKDVGYTAFAASTGQNFARDEIQGNGTSGLYRLSRDNIVINSEKIRVETRDRFRPELIVSTTSLLRHIDYDIDYSAGTLFFRQPVLSRDFNFNPTFIVAEYETIGVADKELNAGGRVATQLLDGKMAAGVSYVRDEANLGKSNLGGVDAKVKLGLDTELRAEAATSNSEALAFTGVDREGDAYLIELEHHNGKLDALAYVKRQGPGFGVNQQNASEAGTFKRGLDGQWRFTDKLALQGQGYRQEDLTSRATRDAGSALLQYRTEQWGVRGGAQLATDEAATGEKFESQQATVGGNRFFFDKKLEVDGQADLSIGGKNDSVDYPSRYQVNAAYAIRDDLRLLSGYEITDGDAFDSRTARVGLQVVPWKGARLTSTLNQSAISEYGPRTFGLFGLTQSFLVGERWGFDASVDTSRTLNESGDAPLIINRAQPFASGGVLGNGTLTEDFLALSGGATYRTDLWSWTGRAETRDGETSDRYGLTTSFLRQSRTGIAFAASAQAFQTEQVNGTEGLLANTSLSWAFRPLGLKWSLLDKLEFRYDEVDNGSGIAGSQLFGATSLNVLGDAKSRRLINNFALNRVSKAWSEKDVQGNLFELNQRNQLSLYYGSKYVLDKFDDEDYTGYSDLLGLEWRYDLTRKWDVGLRGSALHVWDLNNYEYSAGPVIGYSPFDNAWVSVGYNFIGFHDRDFSAAHYTARGPYFTLRFKFDQLSELGGAKPHEQARTADDYVPGLLGPDGVKR
jgi:uncharacterized repeat protein (TIGR01451 family)